MAGQAIYLTRRQIAVAHDVLQSVTAYTEREMADHFGWREAEVNAWSTALDKLADADVEHMPYREER